MFELLAQFPKGLTQAQIASTLDIPKGSLHDLIQALLARGYIEESPLGRRYTLGVRLFEVGSAYPAQMDLLQAASPVIETINALTGESVDLCVRDGADMISIYKKSASFALRYDSALGERIPGHASAVGKALLAHVSPSELCQLLPSPRLRAFTERTLTSKEGFKAHLADVRQSGVAYNLEEMFMGLCAAASAIVDDHGAAKAGLSVTAPTIRFQGKQSIFGELVRLGAEIIAIRLGYRGGNHTAKMEDLKRTWARASD